MSNYKEKFKRTRIGVLFVSPRARDETNVLKMWYTKSVQDIETSLSESFPFIEFVCREGGTRSDILKILRDINDVAGYIVFNFQSIAGAVRPVLWSGKPTIFVAETYLGSGEFLMEYSRAIKAGMPVVGIVDRNVHDVQKLARYIKLLDVINKLRASRMLIIADPVVRDYIQLQYPLSIDIYSAVSQLQTLTGIDLQLVSVRDFVEKYYGNTTDEEARPIAKKWWNESDKVVDHLEDELVKPARLYLAMKKAIEDYNADALGVDCITLYYSGLLDTWPCLGFMELAKEGVVPLCEADVYAGVAMLAMKYFANVPGYINDPALDMEKDEIVYYHCQAPINPHGFDSGEECSYVITPAHWGAKKLSVHTKLPTDESATLVGFNPADKIVTIHTAHIERNEYNDRECATKVVGKAETRAIAENWNWRAGWHRVLFYGDWREDWKALAKLLGLGVMEEDKTSD